MTTRSSIEVLASGQPRPYADSQLHVRLTIEISWLGGPKDPHSVWKPHTGWTEEDIRALLPHLKCGFPSKPPSDWASRRLNSLREISPGVWEFHATDPFTD